MNPCEAAAGRKMDYFYHYTNLEGWEKVQKEGLKPGRAIDDLGSEGLPALAHKPAIFGLLSPTPESWLPFALNGLLLHIRCPERNTKHLSEALVLLKVRLLPSDDVHIGDYDEIMRRRGSLSLPSAYQEAMIAYCESVTKLQEKFNAVAAKKLPEVLCFNAIPASRIELVELLPGTTKRKISSYIAKKIKENNPA